MRNQEKNRKKLLGLIFFFVLLLSFSVGVAIWVVINQDSEEVPGEYFPYDYDVEQEKIFTGKRLEVDNNLVAEPDSAITRIEYYFYNHDDENPLTKVEEAIYPGTYLVKVYANMTDAEGNVSEHEITNVKFDIKKRPIKITVADSDLIYGDKEDKITQSVTYSGYDDITESGFIEGDDESDLGITAENPINYFHSYEQFSNVGNYTLYATGFSSPYYEIEVINGDIDVSPYCLTYSWDEDSFKDIFYNSAGQVPTASTSATLRVQDVCNVIVNVDGEENQINQGTYKATIIGVSNSNYCISGYENDVKDFTIKPLVLKFKWDYPTGGFIYNGKDQKLEATPTNAYASDGITLNTTGTGKHANLKSDCTTKLDGVSRYKSTVESINNNELGNYALPASGLSSEFDIAPKEVTIIWTDLSFIYNGSANTPTATVVATTLIAGDSCLVNYDDGEVNANYIDDNTPIEGKQKYTILPTGLSNTDYRLSTDEASITGYYIVKQKELGITWRNDDLDSTIGKIAYTHVNASTTFHPYADINASDIVSGDSPSLVYEGEQSAANAKLSGEMQIDEETGLAKAEYTAKAKLANEKGNYKLSTDEAVITKNFIIKTAPVYPEWDQTEQVSVFAGRKMARDAITTIFSRVYNSQSQLPIAKITNAAGEILADDLCQVIVHAQEEGFEEWIEEAINAGSYYVETIKVNNTNYELAEVIGASLTIQPKDVYITWGNLVRHYNGSYQNASVSIAADVFENDDCYVKVDTLYSKREANAYYTEAFDDPSDLFGDSYITSLAKNDNGDYALFGEDARNYQFGPDIEGRRNEFEKEFIIKQTLLNVSALRKEITYGDYPTLELEKYISADNLQGTDTIEDLGTLNAKISYKQYDDVSSADDSYNAIWEGATNTNYHYVYHKANYFVKPKPVTITWSADTDHTYDGTYWHPSVTIAGIVNNDSLYCDFSGSEIESNAKTAREYTATVTNLNSDNDKAKNYLLTGDNYDHAFTISQRELTISWDKVSFVYNAELRFPEYTIGNVVDRDIDTLKVVEDTTDYRKNVEYAINADILETNDLNYILPLNNSTKYEITPIILELTWTGLDLTYNGSPQIITPNIFGVLEVEKDLIDVYATDKKINAGDYTATAYLSGNELGNYALPEVHAKDFEIKKVKLTVTLNNHTIIYGEEPTHNNYVLSGFVNNENDSVIDTNNLEYSYSYRQFQNIGSNYKIMATGLDAINYYFEYKDGTLKVDPKEVTISWNVASQYIYNSDYQAPTAEVTNLVNNDTCSVTVSQFVVAGDHTSQVTALGNNNYTYSVIHTQDFTILRKEVTIAWSVGTYTYNKSTQAPTYTPSGIIAGDLCSVEVTGAGMNAGTYTLNAALTGSDKDNYIIKTNSTCGYTIKPKPVSVNWTVISKEYNGEAQFPTYNLVGGISGDVLGEKLSESKTNAGTYTSSINSLTNANYILDETKSTTFRITPVQLSISWGEVSFDYNGRPQKPTAEIAGLVAVDTGKVTVTVNGEQTNAGTYDATAILGGDSGMNYILPTDGEKQAFTINKLWLTVTINNHSIIYGAEPSANGYMITGYIDGEGIDNINVINAKYVHEYTQYGDIGDYDISMTGFAAINYDFRYNNAQLSVTPKEVQIAWTVADYYEYDQQEHAPTATITNLVRPEDSCTVTVSKFVNAGTHSSVVTDLSNKNYYFTSESVGYSKAFTINPRCLDLSWSSLPEYIYNKTTQAPTIASIGGVLAGDVCEVKINGAGMNAGDYTLTTELTGSDKDNYVIKTNATCQYSIKPKTVTIAWSNTTTTYNGGAQAPTYDIVGKYAGDEFDVAISDSVTDAGNHPFVINALGNNNYVLDLTTNSTTFVIEKIKLTVTWTDTEFTYNGQFRKPTATLDNVLSCDIDEVKVNVSGEQKNANDAYEAIATISGNKSGNYEFASDEDKVTFKINKKLLHVYANETSICYGSLPDYCEVTYIGFADGEGSSVLSGELVYASTYNRFDDITTEENIYYISVSGLSSDNYDFEYHAAQLIVYPLDIEIRWGNTEVTYNAKFQHPTATIINLARPEDVVEFGVTEFKDAGTHQARVGFVNNPNYTFGEEDATEFIIKHKEVSITWTNLSFNYDGLVKTPTVILDGVIEGDPCVANINGGTNEVGTHTATVTGLSNANYVLIGDNLSATFTIKKLVIIIIIGNREVTYGDSLAEQGQFTYTYDEAGFEDGDTFENSITGEISFSTDYIAGHGYNTGTQAGTVLPITASGLSSDKYEISYQFGTLKVNRRPIYYTWGNTELTYNGELQVPEVIFTNVLEGETVNPRYDSMYRDYYEDYYEATLIGVDNPNYEACGDMTQRFHINKAPLTITPLANEITYGDILSGKGVTYHGFKGDDDYTDLEGTLTYVSDTYDQSSPVGKYAFRASGLTARNYEIIFEVSELTVKQKDVTITWIATTLTYTGLAQNPNYTYEGIFDDDLDECQIKVVGAVNAGTKHQATISLEGDKASNYKVVNETSPEFTIGKAPLRVIAEANEITYGDLPTNAGIRFEGFVNNEKENVLTGSLAFDYTYHQFDAISSTNNKYYIKPSGYSSTNYSITFVNGELTVNPFEVVVSWSDLEFTYDGQSHIPTATVTNALNNDVVTVTVDGEKVDAGNTHIATAISVSNNNYKLAEIAPTTEFVIKAKSITVSWSNTSLTYNGTTQKPTAEITSESGVVGSESVPLTVDASGKDAATHNAIVSTTNTNYVISNSATTYTIAKATVTVAWKESTLTQQYTGKALFPEYEIKGIFTDYDNESSYQISESEHKINANTNGYAVSISFTSDNYVMDEETNKATFIINPVQLEIVWSDFEFTYNAKPHLPSASISGFVEGETDTITVTVEGAQTDAGRHTATASLSSSSNNANYILPTTGQTKEFVINKAVLTVTPNDHEIVYGDDNSHNGVTYTGFIADSSDTIDNINLTGNVSYSYTYTRYGDVGSYEISIDVSGLESTNYTFKAEAGILTVDPLKVSLSWADTALVYDGGPQKPTATINNLFAVDKDLVYSITVEGEQTNASESAYSATATAITGTSNYIIDSENCTTTFTIAPKPVTITWGETELIYSGGAQAPTATVNHYDLIGTDQCTVNVTGAQTEVGSSYQATASSLSNANYVLSGNNLTTNFSIIKELIDLVVTVINISTTYGDSFTFAVKYTINGEEVTLPSGVTGPLQYTVTTLDGVETDDYLNAGSYKVIASGLDSEGLYNFIYNEGSLDIAKADLTIKAVECEVIYGNSFTEGTIEISGLKYSDNISMFDGTISYSSSVKETDNVGTYAYSITSTLTSDNYNISIDDEKAKVKIVQREVTVTWKAGPFTYTGKTINPITFGNVVNGDILTPSFVDSNGKAETLVGADDYNNITLSGLGNSNYKLPSTGITGSITIGTAKLKLKMTLVDIELDINAREYTNIISKINPTFTDSNEKDIEFTYYKISGMHNGVYYYGFNSKQLGDIEAQLQTIYGDESFKLVSPSETYVYGSTYKVYIEISNPNYEFADSNRNYVILKYKTALANESKHTIEDALATGGTITFDGNSSDKNSYVVTSFSRLTEDDLSILNSTDRASYATTDYQYYLTGNKLVVNHKAGFTATNNIGYEIGKVDKNSGNVFTSLIIPENISLVLQSNAKLFATAYVGFKQPNSTISCERGVIMNNGTITVQSGSAVYAYGYIKGNGYLNLNSGSSAMDLIRTYDWPGGNTGSNVYQYAFPANAWSCHNISCYTKINAGAEYKGSIHVQMDIKISVYNPITETVIIGGSNSDNCLFKATGSTGYIIKYAIENPYENPSDTKVGLSTISGSNQISGQRDIVELYGDFEDDQLNISMNLGIYSVSFSTSPSIAAPIPYMDITVMGNSTLQLTNSSYMFMPGTTLTVEKDAILTINSNVNVAMMSKDIFADSIYTAGGYGFDRHMVGITEDAKMIVKGVVNVSGGSISGKVLCEGEYAILNIIDGSVNTTVTSLHEAKGAGGTPVSAGPNATGTVNDKGFYCTLTANGAYGHVNSVDETLDSLESTKAYESIAGAEEGTYYWKEVPASDLSNYKIIFKDTDGAELGTTIIWQVRKSTYEVSGNEYIYNKLHYIFDYWRVNSATGAELNSTNGLLSASGDLNNPTTITLYVEKHLKSYEINYKILTDDGYVENLEEVSGLTTEFTLEDFTNNGNVLTLSTNINLTGSDSLNFNGWYIGSDSSTNIVITSITLEQFEKYLAMGNVTLNLYGELSGTPFVTVNVTDNEHDSNKAVDTSFVIKSGTTLAENNKSIEISDKYDSDSEYQYYAKGFKYNNTEYSFEDIMNVTFTANSIVELTWDSKEYKIIYNINDGSVNLETITHYFKDYGVVPLMSQTDVNKRSTLVTNKVFFEYWKQGDDRLGETYPISENQFTTTLTSQMTKFVAATITTNGYVSLDIEFNGYVIYDNKINSSGTLSVANSTTAGKYYFLPNTTFGITPHYDNGEESLECSLTQSDGKYIVGTTDFTIEAKGQSCVIEGTLITMADGTKKKVEDLNVGDLLLVFNHETGQYDVSPLLFLNHKDEGYKYYDVLTLLFSNGTELKIVQDHGLFHLESNKYIYINYSNYQEYIGHNFYSADFDGTNYTAEFITLVDAYITKEYTRVYCPVSAFHMNTFTNSLLSMPTIPYGIGGLVNIFEYDENMKYDEEAKQRDIEQYGLFTYEDFAEYMTYEAYMASPAVYLKVSMGKGYITYEEIILVIEYLLSGNLIE